MVQVYLMLSTLHIYLLGRQVVLIASRSVADEETVMGEAILWARLMIDK